MEDSDELEYLGRVARKAPVEPPQSVQSYLPVEHKRVDLGDAVAEFGNKERIAWWLRQDEKGDLDEVELYEDGDE